jgi:tetratricopeptide (TPR) repeat protein
MQDRLAQVGLTAECADLGIELLAGALPGNTDDTTNWETYKALAPHSLAILRLEPAKDRARRSAVFLGSTIGNYLREMARYAEARPLYERALAICEKLVGAKLTDTATVLDNLASLLQAQGDLAAARPLYERALAISEKVLGPEHSRTATSLNNLAGLLHAQGDLAAARPLYERALAIREKVLSPEHPDTATSRASHPN